MIVFGTYSSRAHVQSLLCHTYKLYRAPNGCLQYFTGARSTVKSFNWDGTHACTTGCFLRNQQYPVCFRPEKGIMLQFFRSNNSFILKILCLSLNVLQIISLVLNTLITFTFRISHIYLNIRILFNYSLRKTNIWTILPLFCIQTLYFLH